MVNVFNGKMFFAKTLEISFASMPSLFFNKLNNRFFLEMLNFPDKNFFYGIRKITKLRKIHL